MMLVSCFRKALLKYTKAIGLETRCQPHALRHAYATHQLESGMQLHQSQHQLGHNNIKNHRSVFILTAGTRAWWCGFTGQTVHAMSTYHLADIFDDELQTYREHHAMSYQQQRVCQHIQACRTGKLGY
ncbi:tyrosine-type recombinase/integrase [Pseudoalteromonas luteoviolacea]|uniref:tyrosine-type recombinase/integrase n=1 Tax=Pseudoalteromonas luteoviolacea TaxID=43657 RepID=UPI001FD112BE|nr:tyrosine-type recombinase/integrase [Pseudoalteromonas luteoviolacea]